MNNLLHEKTQLQQQVNFIKRYSSFNTGSTFENKTRNSPQLSELGNFSEDLLTELNKSLSMIGSALSAIQKTNTNDDQQVYFRTIKVALEDIFLLSHKLKLFSCSKQSYERQVDIGQCVKRHSCIFQRSLDSSIEFDLSIERDLFPVSGSFSLLKNLYSNLLRNAEEAIQATGGIGTINVSVLNYINNNTIYDFEGQKIIKQGVVVRVSDNGVGIPEESLKNIFKPFCSTKESHRGLGLAVAYGIIKSHGGNIILQSKANKGTSIDVFLPKYKAQKQSLNRF